MGQTLDKVNPAMRLTDTQIKTIKSTVEELFGSQAQVRLFGSRLDDRIRGGDIDLIVTLPEPCTNRMEKELRLAARLQLRLGDQPFDILVVDPDVVLNPVHDHALATGRPL